jgi:hypothetical protein
MPARAHIGPTVPATQPSPLTTLNAKEAADFRDPFVHGGKATLHTHTVPTSLSSRVCRVNARVRVGRVELPRACARHSVSVLRLPVPPHPPRVLALGGPGCYDAISQRAMPLAVVTCSPDWQRDGANSRGLASIDA